MALIEELLTEIPMAEKMMEIKGVGIKTVTGFLAEVGDITRFDNPKGTTRNSRGMSNHLWSRTELALCL